MANNNIFLGSGASTTLIPEQDIYIPCTGSGTTTTLTPESAFTDLFKLVPNLYIGCTIDIYNTTAGLVSSHTITANSKTTFTLGSPPASNGTVQYALLRAYGSPAPHPLMDYNGDGTPERESLVSDNWLGIMESVTFPNLSQELKQMNLGLGGSRNFTFQYKGLRTADNGSLALVANTGSWLYYALGSVSAITYTSGASTTLTKSTDVFVDASSADDVVIKGSATTADVPTTGPLFYRTVKGGTKLVPPLDHSIYDGSGFVKIPFSGTPSRPTNLINYTIQELNTDQLPSFSLEQTIAKDPATLGGAATSSSNEDVAFTRIARGCRINSLTIEASEGEELKMNMDINARLVDSITDLYQDDSLAVSYVSRANVTDNANLFNWNAGSNYGAPFFFSEGTFTVFGQQFLKVNSVSIEINNNLMDKRYMGGHRDMKEGIPAQRTYNITFEAVVTDDQLFKEMLNETENVNSSAGQMVEFVFTKGGTSEEITLKFKNYFLDTTEITIPDDKGPISFSSTIKPRDLASCVVKTDNILMG